MTRISNHMYDTDDGTDATAGNESERRDDFSYEGVRKRPQIQPIGSLSFTASTTGDRR